MDRIKRSEFKIREYLNEIDDFARTKFIKPIELWGIISDMRECVPYLPFVFKVYDCIVDFNTKSEKCWFFNHILSMFGANLNPNFPSINNVFSKLSVTTDIRPFYGNIYEKTDTLYSKYIPIDEKNDSLLLSILFSCYMQRNNSSPINPLVNLSNFISHYDFYFKMKNGVLTIDNKEIIHKFREEILDLIFDNKNDICTNIYNMFKDDSNMNIEIEELDEILSKVIYDYNEKNNWAQHVYGHIELFDIICQVVSYVLKVNILITSDRIEHPFKIIDNTLIDPDFDSFNDRPTINLFRVSPKKFCVLLDSFEQQSSEKVFQDLASHQTLTYGSTSIKDMKEKIKDVFDALPDHEFDNEHIIEALKLIHGTLNIPRDIRTIKDSKAWMIILPNIQKDLKSFLDKEFKDSLPDSFIKDFKEITQIYTKKYNVKYSKVLTRAIMNKDMFGNTVVDEELTHRDMNIAIRFIEFITNKCLEYQDKEYGYLPFTIKEAASSLLPGGAYQLVELCIRKNFHRDDIWYEEKQFKELPAQFYYLLRSIKLWPPFFEDGQEMYQYISERKTVMKFEVAKQLEKEGFFERPMNLVENLKKIISKERKYLMLEVTDKDFSKIASSLPFPTIFE